MSSTVITLIPRMLLRLRNYDRELRPGLFRIRILVLAGALGTSAAQRAARAILVLCYRCIKNKLTRLRPGKIEVVFL